MPGVVGHIGFAAGFLLAVPALAGLKDIQRDRLPQDPAVLTAYADMLAVEDMVQEWHDKWPFDTPKTGVVSVAKRSLAELQKALASSPANEELLLLAGVVAHYAYNVDVQEAYDPAVSSFEKAGKLAASDYRPAWFLGIHRCQANEGVDGMGKLLAIEERFPWEQLPPSFWDDYIRCASTTDLPAHLLRAGDHVAKLKATPSAGRDFLIGLAKKRFKEPDLAATYSGRGEVWRSAELTGKVTFTSTMCGLSFAVPGGWHVAAADATKGICRAVFETSPHQGRAGQVFPNIIVIVRQPKSNETLEDFLKSFLHGNAAEKTTLACPLHECVTFESVQAEAYGPEGDGHFLMAAFRRDAPEFPGLLFEKPVSLSPAADGQAHYFRPVERLHRLEGALYYFIGLDTADSVRTKAILDYNTFLLGLKAE